MIAKNTCFDPILGTWKRSKEEKFEINSNLHAPLIQGLFHQVSLVEQSLWDRLCHLSIVGELDWLIFAIGEHYQFHHWSLPVG